MGSAMEAQELDSAVEVAEETAWVPAAAMAAEAAATATVGRLEAVSTRLRRRRLFHPGSQGDCCQGSPGLPTVARYLLRDLILIFFEWSLCFPFSFWWFEKRCPGTHSNAQT